MFPFQILGIQNSAWPVAILRLCSKIQPCSELNLSCIKPSCCRTQMRNAYEVPAEVL